MPSILRAAVPILSAAILSACSPPAAGTDAGMDASLDALSEGGAPDASTPTDAPSPSLDAPAGNPLAWALDRAGPFNVGYRTWDITYTPPGGHGPRNVKVHVWYPTLATDGAHPRYLNIFADPRAIVDAPLAASVYARGYPVHVYSHGHRGFAGSSYYVMDHFASHGWVAIAPDHTGNLLSDSDEQPPAILYWRPADITATLDSLAARPAADPLSGRTDLTRVVMSGHSFGTHTVWTNSGATFDLSLLRARCPRSGNCTEGDYAAFGMNYRDARIIAGIPMAGAISRDVLGPNGHTGVHIPMLAMSGTDDPVGADAQWASTTGVDLTWVEITGGCHQFFALGGCPNAPDADRVPTVGAYTLAFARRHVLGDNDPRVLDLLSGRQTPPRATLHTR